MSSTIVNLLQKTHLKHVEIKTSKAISFEDTKAISNKLDEVHRRVRAADLENWYESLKAFTYPTVFLPITIEEGCALMRAHESLKKYASKRDDNDVKALDSLRTRLEKELKPFPDGVFAKLSSRSPKDVAVKSSKTKEIFAHIRNESKQWDDNCALIALNQAHIESLKVKSATALLDLFIQSERIYEDLELAHERAKAWSQKIVIRKWVNVPIAHEIRAFVVNNRLTCMCQYYHYCYFPSLDKNKEKIQSLILDCFDTVSKLVPISPKEYVMDFAVDLDNNRCWVIEINPFGEFAGMGTSPAMFDLVQDHDTLFGKAKFEFRIETGPYRGDLRRIVGADWRDLLSSYPRTAITSQSNSNSSPSTSTSSSSSTSSVSIENSVSPAI
eukprot:TRINITY_DN4572_c0_g1_i1.p1 TRINITY_DN4572_c0_g1~~TRINITY_DN4572_c0_g1_i1.p1  ORF type:complete len:385 (+),score=50.97 TRINITY_DN4572_c0_g1_i1:80-1234(+)